MKKYIILKRFALTVLAFALYLGVALAQQITIYCTNDLHGHLLREKEVHIIDATYVGALKHKDSSKTLLLDAGDMAYGMPVADVKYVDQLASLLNLVGYDAMTLGNHEFDNGLEVLSKRVKASTFPYVSANVTNKSDKKIYLEQFRSHKNVQHGDSFSMTVNGIKVGIFGLTTSHAAVPLTSTLDFDGDYKKIATAQVKKLRDAGAKVVIALTHIGKPEHSEELLAIPGLDIIIDGHSHEQYVVYNTDKSKVLIQTGTEARKVGQIVYDCATNKVTDAKLLSFDDVAGVARYEALDKAANDLLATIRKDYPVLKLDLPVPFWGGSVKCQIDGKDGYREPLRLTQTMLGKLWAYAILYKINKEQSAAAGSQTLLGSEYGNTVVVKNGGSFRKGLPDGDLSMEDIFAMIPNNSKVYQTKITPKNLHKLLSAGIAVMDIKDGIRVSKANVSQGIFLQTMPPITGNYDPKTNKTELGIADVNEEYSYPIDPNDDTTLMDLITTEYVMKDSSYGDVKYTGTPVLLGREQDILKWFFDNCTLDPEDLVNDLISYQEREALFVAGETTTPTEEYTPRVILKYNDQPACGDVRYMIYPSIYYSSEDIVGAFTTSSQTGEISIPFKLSEPAMIRVECDIEVQTAAGKVLVTLTGSTYADPAMGCGTKYPLIIDLQR